MRHYFFNRRFSLLVIFSVVAALSYAQTKRTIHVAEAGTLSSYISDAEKYQIEELTLTGELNGADIRLLRDMAGNNDKGELTLGQLKVLDIGNVTIIEGEDLYIDTGTISFEDRGSYYGVFKIATQNNVLGQYMFAGCKSLEQIVLPQGITEIGDYAFWGCTRLKSFNVPKNVSFIGSWVLEYCQMLSIIEVDNENVYFDSRNNCNAIINSRTNILKMGCKNTIIPEGITEIRDNAFSSCSGLTSIRIPSGVETIGSYAFNGCSGLREITLPQSLKTIKARAFMGCNLEQIALPSSLVSIGSEAFRGCAITCVDLPASVEQVTGNVFGYCLNLEAINVDAANPHYCSIDGILYTKQVDKLIKVPAKLSGVFSVPSTIVYIGESSFEDCRDIVTVNLPDGVKIIDNNAFMYCYGLSSVNIPNSVTRIGSSAFGGCSSLQSVIIPNSVTSIGNYAFQSCPNLNSVIIGSGVTSIGYGAFSYCEKLSEVTCLAATVPATQSIAFSGSNIGNATLYVPKSSVESYSSAEPWSGFKEIIALPVNELSCDNMECSIGAKSVLKVNLQNEDEIKLCQFDLRLPAGVTVATTGAGKLNVNLTDRAESHRVSGSQLSNGDYRFVVSSMDNDSFTGNSGTLLEITLDISESMEIGEYVVKILNSELSVRNGSDWKVVKPADAESGLIIKNYTPGDVNDDGSVSVTDVGCTINYILEKVPDVFIFAAADMNDDRSISVTDVGMIIDHILNAGVTASRQRSSQDVLNAELSLVPVAEGYQLMLENKDAFVSYQMDIQLANGATINGLKQNDDNHRLTFNRLDDGNYRVVCYSLSNSTFQDDASSLLNISTTGDIIINDIRLTTARFNELRPMALSGTSTGISNVEHGMQVSVQGKTLQIVSDSDTTINIYSLGGSICRVLNLHRGVNSIDGLRSGVYMIGNRKVIIR